MNKIINSYAGDSISIRCRIYDESGAEFNSSAFQIDGAKLAIVGVNSFDGTVTGNVASAFIPAGTIMEPGKYEYYMQVLSAETETCFTVLSGTIIVQELPQ